MMGVKPQTVARFGISFKEALASLGWDCKLVKGKNKNYYSGLALSGTNGSNQPVAGSFKSSNFSSQNFSITTMTLEG